MLRTRSVFALGLIALIGTKAEAQVQVIPPQRVDIHTTYYGLRVGNHTTYYGMVDTQHFTVDAQRVGNITLYQTGVQGWPNRSLDFSTDRVRQASERERPAEVVGGMREAQRQHDQRLRDAGRIPSYPATTPATIGSAYDYGYVNSQGYYTNNPAVTHRVPSYPGTTPTAIGSAHNSGYIGSEGYFISTPAVSHRVVTRRRAITPVPSPPVIARPRARSNSARSALGPPDSGPSGSR